LARVHEGRIRRGKERMRKGNQAEERRKRRKDGRRVNIETREG
jgi:hypothetical protein